MLLFLLIFPSGFDSQIWPMLREHKVISLKCSYGLNSATLLFIPKCTLVLQLLTLPTKIHCVPASNGNSKEQWAAYTESILYYNCQHSSHGWVSSTSPKVPCWSASMWSSKPCSSGRLIFGLQTQLLKDGCMLQSGYRQSWCHHFHMDILKARKHTWKRILESSVTIFITI